MRLVLSVVMLVLVLVGRGIWFGVRWGVGGERGDGLFGGWGAFLVFLILCYFW